MNIVLFEPQIPQNTGNIVRTCSETGAKLFLVKPLGFSISNKKLKRAGLDYWNEVEISLIDDLFDFLDNTDGRFVNRFRVWVGDFRTAVPLRGLDRPVASARRAASTGG